MAIKTTTTAVAVYCGASPGRQNAYQHAAHSLGKALAVAKRQLVYGGGSNGIMGVVSGAALRAGGEVIGVIPYAMLAAGGEKEKVTGDDSASKFIRLREEGRETMEWVVVNSMHERKVEMSRRSCGFVGLPGGYGTLEEIFEVTTWTQLGIHSKPVVLANVLGFFEPIRTLIQAAIKDGFIQPAGANLVKFVDGPSDHSLHESFDWGKALLEEIDSWKNSYSIGFDWTRSRDGGEETEALSAT